MWFIPKSETMLINKLVHIKWMSDNKDKISAKKKAYNDSHKEQNYAHRKAYIKANPEKVRAWDKAKLERDRDKIRARRKVKYEARKAEGYRKRRDPITGKQMWVFVGTEAA